MSNTVSKFIQRALISAPFLVALWSGVLPPALARGTDCTAARFDEQVTVRYVYDGDTVQLSDGRKLRLIGINTPERGRDDQPAEPHADVARQHLHQWRQNSRQWFLVYDQQRQDRYGRLLAHVFDGQGRNITQQLLRDGAGQLLVIPPNLKFIHCYRQAQQAARRAGHGVWALPEYQPVTVEQLLPETRGYRMVTGQLTRIGESRSSLWLNLGKHFALRLKKGDLSYFNRQEIATWVGRRITAQGWIYRYKGQSRMRLRHPAALIDQEY